MVHVSVDSPFNDLKFIDFDLILDDFAGRIVQYVAMIVNHVVGLHLFFEQHQHSDTGRCYHVLVRHKRSVKVNSKYQITG